MPRRRFNRRLAASMIFLAISLLLTLLSRRVPTPIVRYVCPLLSAADFSQPSEIAACHDCTYYPVDKLHALPATYTPIVYDTGLPGGGKMVPAAVTALQSLFAEATQRGLSPVVTSAYRSYNDQAATFSMWSLNEWKSTFWLTDALLAAQHYSALPGHSEHQLGTTVDLNCQGCTPFDDNDERNLSLWRYLAENAHRFGFVISYPPNAEPRTGYQSEPWHIRYVGAPYATELFDQGYTRGNDICPNALLRIKHRY